MCFPQVQNQNNTAPCFQACLNGTAMAAGVASLAVGVALLALAAFTSFPALVLSVGTGTKAYVIPLIAIGGFGLLACCNGLGCCLLGCRRT